MAFRYGFGALLVVVGAGLLVEQMYPVVNFSHWLTLFWPLAIILLGVLILLTRSASRIGGIVILLAGCVLQVSALGILQANVWDLIWPMLLVVLGVYVIFRNKRIKPAGE